jgi:hypothetical protein
MTVKELRDELEKYPDEMPVVVADWYHSEFTAIDLCVEKREGQKHVWAGTPDKDYLILNDF